MMIKYENIIYIQLMTSQQVLLVREFQKVSNIFFQLSGDKCSLRPQCSPTHTHTKVCVEGGGYPGTQLACLMRSSSGGNSIISTGCRDYFLHQCPEHLSELHSDDFGPFLVGLLIKLPLLFQFESVFQGFKRRSFRLLHCNGYQNLEMLGHVAPPLREWLDFPIIRPGRSKSWRRCPFKNRRRPHIKMTTRICNGSADDSFFPSLEMSRHLLAQIPP